MIPNIFYLLSGYCLSADYLIRNNGWPYSTTSSLFTRTASTHSVVLTLYFIHQLHRLDDPRTWPFLTVSPTDTNASESGDAKIIKGSYQRRGHYLIGSDGL